MSIVVHRGYFAALLACLSAYTCVELGGKRENEVCSRSIRTCVDVVNRVLLASVLRARAFLANFWAVSLAMTVANILVDNQDALEINSLDVQYYCQAIPFITTTATTCRIAPLSLDVEMHRS
jgi:hypothetical protein